MNTDGPYSSSTHSEPIYPTYVGIVRSERTIKNLEDDIDRPMRLLVAGTALLGANPKWSCCGFNYNDQPEHKDHSYGLMQLILDANREIAVTLAKMAVKDTDNKLRAHFVNMPNQGIHIAISSSWKLPENGWGRPDSPHFYEVGVVAIQAFEKLLFRHSDLFSTEAVLNDTNLEMQSKLPDWQYAGKSPWHIRKDQILQEYKEKYNQ